MMKLERQFEMTAFLIFFINSVEYTINSVNEISIRRHQVINSVSIRRWNLSIRWNVPKLSESLNENLINSVIFPKLSIESLIDDVYQLGKIQKFLETVNHHAVKYRKNDL